MSDGAEGAIWSGGPNREASAPAGAAPTAGNSCIQTVGQPKNIPPDFSGLARETVGRSCFISAGSPAGRIMPPMTQARTRANEVGSPSPSQLSLAAMLRAFVELVLHAASTLWMRWRCLSRDWHTGDAATALPEATSGIQPQEVQPDRRAPARLSAHRAETTLTLMVSSTRSARQSNHEDVLTDASHTLALHRDRAFLVPLIPAKAGTQSRNGTRATIPQQRTPSWIPAFAWGSTQSVGRGEIALTPAPA